VSSLEDIFAVIVSVLSVVVPILMVIIVFLTIWLIATIIERRRKKKFGETF